ncbi:hypothetical protein [Roseomonas indoligenes]|uniref:Uncharacterized protein n=1 Tax=Roseomonas indoligenes TaxID=2820811 RepID=A0A940S4J7_9PROT|nr:hypothetical protein [Pararoseomonas indoligenes]MBP0493391.1 hypothetical protein [Pararoseomonas indoligenes]
MFDAIGPAGPASMISGCGPLSGPSYLYRGATIDGNAQATLFRITMPGHLIDGWSGMCRLDDAIGLIDAAHGQRERALQLLSPPERTGESLGRKWLRAGWSLVNRQDDASSSG